MRRLPIVASVFACLLAAAPLIAQQAHRDALSKDEIEKIKEFGIEPDRRIGYFIKILNDRADAMKGLIKRAATSARDNQLDGKLQDFTAIMDELGDNLDEYGDRQADLRGSLKTLNDSTSQWMAMLRALPATPAFDVARQDAIESLGDLADQGKRMLDEQIAYFKAHPKQKGQQRVEPQ